MQIKRYVPAIGAVVFILGMLLLSQMLKKYNYNYLYINNQYYFVSNAPVEQDELLEQIGEVKRYRGISIFKINYNGDSNSLPVGAKIYSINSSPNCKEIAALSEDGYRKAYIIVNNRN